MNCTDARSLLPAHVYGDLPVEDAADVAAHLRLCLACRAECAELSQVRLALDVAPAPAVRVDVSQLFHRVAERQSARVRRWRRFAWASCAVAAGVLLVFGLRLEIRAADGQLSFSWGHRPVVSSEVSSVSREALPSADYRHIEDRIRLLQEVTHALAAEVEDRDRQHQAENNALRARLDSVQQLVAQNWAEAQRLMSALYVAHFKRPEEKSNP